MRRPNRAVGTLFRLLFASLAAALALSGLIGAATAGPAAIDACKSPESGLDRLVCADPALATLAADGERAAARSGGGEDQQRWLDGRAAACPAVARPKPGPLPGSAQYEAATACLKAIYRQRLAVLRYSENKAAWPKVPFLPKLVDGAGDRLCRALHRDLVAGYRGAGLFVDPLGEREIGFAPQPGLGDEATRVLRADIDAYNAGKPVPVLQWIDEADHGGDTVEYRVFGSPGELLSAIGRGVEPLTVSVRAAAHPLIEPSRPAGTAQQPLPLVARSAVVPIDEMARFFRAGGHVYLLAPLAPAAGAKLDLGVYLLSGPAKIRRICLFEAHPAGPPPALLTGPQVEAMRRAAGPLSPTGRLCRAPTEEARTLVDRAAWRAWVLEQGAAFDPFAGGKLQLYMRNHALNGPEEARQYRVYVAAREAAITALAPFYRDEFGRSPAAARQLAALYADRSVSDGFEIDPDDTATLALFTAGYAAEHAAQRAALDGESAELRKLLGDHPKQRAEMLKGRLDETLLTDALDHPESLTMLLGLGLNPNEEGASGRTPLMVAARLDLVEAAKLLLAHGAKPDLGAGDAVAQTDRGGDPLCMKGAAAHGDTPGRTALSYAAEYGSPALVRLLLDHGAKAGMKDSAGRRPADYLKDRRGDPAQSARIAAMLK